MQDRAIWFYKNIFVQMLSSGQDLQQYKNAIQIGENTKQNLQMKLNHTILLHQYFEQMAIFFSICHKLSSNLQQLCLILNFNLLLIIRLSLRRSIIQQKREIMNQKFTVEHYQLCVNFKSDNALVISAQFTPTGQLFLSQTVELMRIKKDTVIATLQRKSQKNLRCQFQQIVNEQHKQLVIKFIVSFDFLPEFSEQIHLDYVEKKESIKTMQANNFRADIQKLQSMVDALHKNGVWNYYQIGATAFTTQKTVQLKKIQVVRSKYLIRVSGVYTNSLGAAGGSDHLIFQITIPGQAHPIKKNIAAYSLSGYSYPYFFEQVIDCKQGQVVVSVKSNASQGSYSNNFVVVCPV